MPLAAYMQQDAFEGYGKEFRLSAMGDVLPANPLDVFHDAFVHLLGKSILKSKMIPYASPPWDSLTMVLFLHCFILWYNIVK